MSGQRLNPFQHALKRPDAYIGSVKTTQIETYVFEGDRVSTRNATYNVGLMNIIREIGSNCIDNKWRSNGTMNSIRVIWDTENKKLTFWNDGVFIPVEKKNYEYEDYRKKTTISEEMYPAEVFFGEMLAGTNFNDDEGQERKTSGRNGMGSKCTVVFSKEFTVRHTDSNVHKQFLQTYTDNGTNRTKPKITAYNAKTAFTEISFIPDFARFNYDINEVENDFIGLLGIYVLEIAAVTSLPVHFTNGEAKRTYHFKTFDKYVRMFYSDVKAHKLASIKLKNGDECIVVESHVDDKVEIPDMLDGVRHLSYVNGVKTKSGGVHVDAWRDAIFPSFVRTFNAIPSKGKNNALKTTAKEVYPYITLFLRTEVDKPEFDQQTKDLLNGPKYELTPTGKSKFDKEEQVRIKEEIETLVTKMLKWNFIALLREKLLAKTGKGTSKVTKAERRVGFGEKTQDANDAGIHPELCILYISEGLSAKAFVVRGISHLERGQDRNGVFAIQGKFINVTKATMKEIMANPEAPKLMKMLNLKIGIKYDKPENFKTLRYHKIRFATDMDDDGIHIRGLLMNFFYKFWPELYEMGVISSISTAVAKVWFTGKKDKDVRLFFSNPEYKKWYNNDEKKLKIAEVKYLKGLASINPKDTPGYFNDPKIVKYYAEGDENEYMKLGFENEPDMRKEWLLRDMNPDSFTKNKLGREDKSENASALESESEDDYVYDGDLGLSTFVDKQLIIYHRMALERALPSIMDGLKDGQRKVLYAIRKRNYTKTTDLEKVTGAVKEISGYHHGAASLMLTIKNLAIRYPGSNNIALLQSDGEFGTRLSGPAGKDAGAPRYIATALEPVAKALFKSEDDPLLTRVIEDDVPAEYEYFVPILCTLLINGAEGIASGFATKIPNYNPDDILKWTLAWLDGKHESQKRLVPWYRGVTGPIELEYNKTDKNPIRWRSTGVLTECCKGCSIMVGNKKCNGMKDWWHITDLPVGLWTNTFKLKIEYLESCNPPDGTKWKKLESRCITDYKDYNTANKVHFMIKPAKEWEPSIETTLKSMTAPNSLFNMILVDTNGYPLRYNSAEDILEAWCQRRLVFYDKRYEHILALYRYELAKAKYKFIFVKAVVDKKLEVHQEDEDLEKDMLDLKLVKMSKSFLPSEDDKEGEDEKNEPSFDYLLSMHMRSMTIKKLEELRKEIENAKAKILLLKSKTSKDLWREDLSKFQEAYKKYLHDYPLI